MDATPLNPSEAYDALEAVLEGALAYERALPPKGSINDRINARTVVSNVRRALREVTQALPDDHPCR